MASAQDITSEARRLFEEAVAALDTSQKIPLLQRALAISHAFSAAREELVWAFFTIGQYDSVIHHIGELTDYDKNEGEKPEVWILYGRAYSRLGQNQTALNSYAKAIKMAAKRNDNTNLAEAYYWKGQTHVTQGDTALAKEAYHQALESQSEHEKAKDALTHLERKLEPNTEASATDTTKILSGGKSQTALAEDLLRNRPEKQLEQQKPIFEVPEKNVSSRQDSLRDQPNLSVRMEPTTIKPTKIDTPKVFETGSNHNRTNWTLVFTGALIVVLVLIGGLVYYRNYQRQTRENRKFLKYMETIEASKEFPPPKIPRYRIDDNILGQGGMGLVYKAYDRNLNDRPVALKVMNMNQFSNQHEYNLVVKRFPKEKEVLAKLNHPNIVSLYDFNQGDDEFRGKFFYMTMEYVDGHSIEQLLAQKGRFNLSEAVKIIKQTGEALDHAHKRDVVHRDLKPSNIMLNKEGWVKVLDFGIAKILAPTDPDMKTQTGVSLGTPGYMPLEQRMGGRLDGRSDIYSLGIVFFQMLTSKPPNDIEEIGLGKPLPKPSSIWPEIPGRIDTIIAKMTAPNRERRYQKAKEVIDALNALGERIVR